MKLEWQSRDSLLKEQLQAGDGAARNLQNDGKQQCGALR
jgi:hypothetical protein